MDHPLFFQEKIKWINNDEKKLRNWLQSGGGGQHSWRVTLTEARTGLTEKKNKARASLTSFFKYILLSSQAVEDDEDESIYGSSTNPPKGELNDSTHLLNW